MGIELVTYTNKAVSPQDDALVYQTAVPQSGVIFGIVVTIKNATTLHVSAGHGIICGRKFTVSAQDISVSLAGSGTKKGRLYIHLDLASPSAPIQFLTQIADNLTPVVQEEDANISNGIYEFDVAYFDVGTSTLSNLSNVAPPAKSITTKVITKTLSAGATTLSFPVPTTGDHLIDFFTNTGIAYKAIDLSVSGTATLTFNAQTGNVVVSCKIEEM